MFGGTLLERLETEAAPDPRWWARPGGWPLVAGTPWVRDAEGEDEAADGEEEEDEDEDGEEPAADG